MSRGFLREHVHWIGLAVGVLVFTIYGVLFPPARCDDTFIFLRYADHLAHGQGPVFNPGERVEGYTSFLWMVSVAAGMALGAPGYPFAIGFGIVLVAAVLLLAAHAHRFVPGMGKGTSAVAVMLAGTCGSFTSWSLRGMEVGLTALLVLATILIHSRARGPQGTVAWRRWGAVCCALSMMCRPELALLVGVLFLDWVRHGIRHRNRAALEFAAVVALVYGPYFAWRWTYYGWPVPNTFYAKVGSTWDQVERGVRGGKGFLERSGVLVALVVAGLAWRRLGFLAAPGIWLLLHCVYVVSVGGDRGQYYAAMLPAMALVAAVSLSRLVRRPAVATAIVLAVFAQEARAGIDRAPEARPRRAAFRGTDTRPRDLALWLRERYPPETLIAVNAAGQLPFYTGFRVLDMLGLNDEHIAHCEVEMGNGPMGHEKSDAEYVLSRKPDLIQFGGGLGAGMPVFVSDATLFTHPEFMKWYALRIIELPTGGRPKLYVRLDEPRSEEEWTKERQALRAWKSRVKRGRATTPEDEPFPVLSVPKRS